MALNKNPGTLMDLVEGFNLVDSNKRHKVELFLTERLMKGGNVVAGRQEEVFGKLLDLLHTDNFVGPGREAAIEELGNFASKQGILESLKSEMGTVFSSDSKGVALRKRITNVVDLPLKGLSLGDPVAWKTFYNLNDITSGRAELKQLHESVAKAWENSSLSKLSNTSLSFDSYTSSSFKVGGNTQAAHTLGISVMAGNQAIHLDIGAPSKSGFLTGYSHGGFGDPGKSNHIYAVQKNFINTAERTTEGWKAGKVSNYQQAQDDWFKQLLDDIDNQITGGNPDKSYFKHIQKSFRKQQMQAQQELGNAALFSNKTLLPATRGRLNLLNRMREQGIMWSPFLREKSLGLDKFGPDLFEIMEQRGTAFVGSAQQTSKGKGLLRAGGLQPLGAGIGDIGAHKEPLKFYKQFDPIVDSTKTFGPPGAKFAPTSVGTLGGDLGKVRMNRMVGSFFDPEVEVAPGVKARQAFGQGSAPVKKNVFTSGRMDLQDIGTYKVDIRTIGDKTRAQVDPSLAKAMEALRTGKGSTTIAPGSTIGMESGTGRLLTSMSADKFVDERLLHYEKDGDILKIFTSQDVRGTIEKGVARHDLKGISPTSALKSMFSPTEEGTFKKLSGGVVTDAEMMLRADMLKDASQYRYLTSGSVAYSFGTVKDAPKSIRDMRNVSNLDIANKIVGQEGDTFAGKTARFVINEMEAAKLSQTKIDDALQNVLAPYNAWGKKLFQEKGAGEPTFGSDSFNKVQKELSDMVGKDRAAKILGSKKQMHYLAEYRMPGFSKSFGYGVKGTIEPRFFTSAKVAGLNAVMDELQSRTTNFSKPISELKTVAEVAKGKISLEGYESIDLEKAVKDPLSWGAGEGKLVRMPKGYGLPESIYVPSGEQTKMMDQFITANSLSRPKKVREIFQHYFKTIHEIKSIQDSAKITVEATKTFNTDIKNAMMVMVTGESGGAAKGVLRGTVEGSLFLPNIAAAESVMGEQFQTAVKAVQAEGGEAADIMIMSRKSIRKMYGDAITDATKKGNATMAALYEQQRKALLSKDYYNSLAEGKASLGTVATHRHPGIGARSMTASYIIPDIGKHSDLEHYVKGLEYEMSYEAKMTSRTGKDLGSKSMKTIVGTMQSLNFDFDGDAFVLSAIGKEEARNELKAILRGKHSERHALRYSMIKDIAKKNVNLKFPSTQAASIVSDRAAAAVKTITPQLSNIFTELKHAVVNSELSKAGQLDLFGLLEAAEQVPIHGKKLVDVPDVARVFFEKASVLRESIGSSNAAKVQSSAGDLFDFLMGKDLGNVEIYAQNRAKDSLNLNVMRQNFIDMSTEYAVKDSTTKSFFEAYQKTTYGKYGNKVAKGATEDIDTLWKLLGSQDHLMGTVKEAEGLIQETRAHISRKAQGTIAEGIESAGKAAAGKLPTKGIIGIAAIAAAGLVAASVSSVALGPSFSSGSGGSKRTVEDLSAFKDQMNPFLHHGGIYNPPKAYLTGGAQPETRIHLPPGGYPQEGVQAMVGSVNAAFPSVENRVEIMDGRADIDKHFLYKIKNEII